MPNTFNGVRIILTAILWRRLVLASILVSAPLGLAQETQLPSQSTIASGPATEPKLTTPDPTAHFWVFGVGLGLGIGGAVSWKFIRTWTGKFDTIHEGFFGADTYAGGADKLGHYFTDFVLVRGLNELYSSYGYSTSDSILNALIGSVTIRTVMEVADGFTTFRFSPEDIAANCAGSLTSAFLLAYPTLDQIFGISYTYMPSQEKLDGKVDWVSIDNDYNGAQFHLDVRLKGVARWIDPESTSPLDIYTTGITYYTRGYDRARETKHRMVGLEAGLNLEEMINRFGDPTGLLYKMRPFFKYYKLPFTYGGPVYDIDQKKYGLRFGLNYFY